MLTGTISAFDFQSKMKASGLERLELPVRASRAFGKDQNGRPFSESIRSFIHALDRFSGVIPFDADILCFSHGSTQERNLHQLLFQDKLELNREVREQK